MNATIENETPAAKGELGRRARRGALWAVVGYGGGRALALISSPLISYFIVPAVRGVMELVNPFLIAFELLSDLGLGPSIVQNKRGADPAFTDVAWTLSVARGIAIWIAVCVGAVPYAWLMGHEELATVIPVAGLVAVAGGCTSTKVFTASRQLTLGRLTVVEIGSQSVGFVVKIVWASLSPTVWSLVFGGLSVAITKMLLSHLVLPGRIDRLRWDPVVARELIRFGRWIFLSTLLTFLTGYADRWIFGAMIPLTMLGLYGNAAVLAALPIEVLSRVSTQVVFPLYSRIVQAGEDLRPAFLRARLPLQLFGGWAISGLVAGGPTAMRLFWEESWWGSGWMIQILAVSAWFLACEATNGAAMLARGEPRWIAFGSMGKLAAMCVLIPIAHAIGGFPAALVAYASTELVRYAISLWAVSRVGLGTGLQDLALTALVGGVGVTAWQLAEVLRAQGVPVAMEAAAIALVVTLAWAPLAWRPISVLRRERLAARAPSPAQQPVS